MMFLLSTRALAVVAGLADGVGFWVLSTVWLGLSSKGVKALALRFEAGASNTSWFSGDSFLTRSAEYRVMLGLFLLLFELVRFRDSVLSD